jgi:hypothetical protein
MNGTTDNGAIPTAAQHWHLPDHINKRSLVDSRCVLFAVSVSSWLVVYVFVLSTSNPGTVRSDGLTAASHRSKCALPKRCKLTVLLFDGTVSSTAAPTARGTEADKRRAVRSVGLQCWESRRRLHWNAADRRSRCERMEASAGCCGGNGRRYVRTPARGQAGRHARVRAWCVRAWAMPTWAARSERHGRPAAP